VAQCYTSLRSTTDPKVKKFNNDMFTQYLTEIHNILADTWRISPETVQEYGQIVNFQASRHNMWLAGKEGSNQGVVVAEVLCDNAGHPHGGPRVA
jgi:hypothetical protein